MVMRGFDPEPVLIGNGKPTGVSIALYRQSLTGLRIEPEADGGAAMAHSRRRIHSWRR